MVNNAERAEKRFVSLMMIAVGLLCLSYALRACQETKVTIKCHDGIVVRVDGNQVCP